MSQIWIWIGFHLFLFGALALDLLVIHRKAHEVGVREALLWSLAWIISAVLFFVGIYVFQGNRPALHSPPTCQPHYRP